MTETTTTARSASEPPQAAVSKRRGISMVWLIPLVALLIGAFLGYRAYISQGPTITIGFETAEGLEAGKTKIRYLDVVVGTVDAVDIAPDLKRIVVTASMVPGASEYLREQTRFWIVKPRIGVGGVSGLGTLLSGAYIGLAPGDGAAARQFTGLEEPPPISANVPGQARLDTVGPPLTGVEVKIADDGEILVKGELVMHGYWKDEAGTAQALRDGWLHTGDIGEIDADGCIRITDRKKDIIVNSGGDNVAPARVEGVLLAQGSMHERGQLLDRGERQHRSRHYAPWCRSRGAACVRLRQADGAASRAHGGLGLGLTLVRRLVELHRGTVTARSEGLGRGSEFVVRLPCMPPGGLPAPGSRRSRTARRRPRSPAGWRRSRRASTCASRASPT